ncbi:hypothetical protein LM13656_240013 [Listeria monocytogenes]|nr:hypothetical protein LM13656_240013 [Listeria monocytogenes]CUM22444.1 hypothetical protein LM900701_290013 [Listeria monocytogenes]CUM27660.1 hypothetical protein LM900865_180013 [Listeria monocytogenes]
MSLAYYYQDAKNSSEMSCISGL